MSTEAAPRTIRENPHPDHRTAGPVAVRAAAPREHERAVLP